MGPTPIPCIPPPAETFEQRLRRELTPSRDWVTDALSLSLTAAVMMLVAIPFVWWLTA